MACHVITVGTSILTNYRRAHEAGPSSPSLPEAGAVSEWVAARPAEASAELASFLPYLEKGGVDEVYLVHTETEEGRFCAGLVHRYLEGRRVVVLEKSVPGIASGEPERVFLEGLGRLRDAVSSYARKQRKQGHEVLINATAGYKPEIAVLVLVAGVLGCRVYYRHEKHPEPVELPPLLPVRLGDQILALLRQMEREADRRLVRPHLPEFVVLDEAQHRGLVELRFDDAGEPFEAVLTPAGKFAVELYGEKE